MTSIIFNCLQNTTAHGIPHIFDSSKSKIWRRLLWFIFTAVCMSGFTLQTWILYQRNLKEETIFNTKLGSMPFIQPDIHICNNRLFAESYFLYPPINELKYMNDVKKDILKFDDDVKKYKPSNSTYYNLFWASVGVAKLFKAFSYRYYQSVLFIECNGVSIKVTEQSVDVVMNFDHLVCFRITEKACKFQTPLDLIKIYLYSENHHDFSTTDKVNITLKGYNLLNYRLKGVPTLHQSLDFTVYFTPKNAMPYISTEKLQIKSTEEASIVLKSAKYIRRPHKYFRCTDNHLDGKNNLMSYYNILSDKNDDQVYFTEESMCFYDLLQKTVFDKFGCYHHVLPIRFSKSIKTVQFCFDIYDPNFDIKRATQIQHFLYQSSARLFEKCFELYPCTYMEYSSKLSGNLYPSLKDFQYNLDLFSRWIDIKQNEGFGIPGLSEVVNATKNSSSVELFIWTRNFAAIRITSGEYNSSIVEESLVYDSNSLSSDIGGILGFYMGASLLTVAELIVASMEYIVMLHLYIKLRLGYETSRMEKKILH